VTTLGTRRRRCGDRHEGPEHEGQSPSTQHAFLLSAARLPPVCRRPVALRPRLVTGLPFRWRALHTSNQGPHLPRPEWGISWLVQRRRLLGHRWSSNWAGVSSDISAAQRDGAGDWPRPRDRLLRTPSPIATQLDRDGRGPADAGDRHTATDTSACSCDGGASAGSNGEEARDDPTTPSGSRSNGLGRTSDDEEERPAEKELRFG